MERNDRLPFSGVSAQTESAARGRIRFYFMQLTLQLMYEGFCSLEVTGRFDCTSRSDSSLFSRGVKTTSTFLA